MGSPTLAGLLDSILVIPSNDYKLFEHVTISDPDALDQVWVEVSFDPEAGTLVFPEMDGLGGAEFDEESGILTLPFGSPQSLINALKDISFFAFGPSDLSDGTTTLTVTVTDLEENSISKEIEILMSLDEPIAGNVPPTDLGLSSWSVYEGSPDGAVIGELQATDANPFDIFIYDLIDSADGRFTLDGNQLKVADGSLLDFETGQSHEITVSVTDSGGETFEKTLTIEVLDVADEAANATPQAPTALVLSPATVKEGAAAGISIGQLDASDPNLGDTVSFTLLDDADGRFVLDGDQIQVANGVLIDFEQSQFYEIKVRVTDSTDLSMDKVFTIGVKDVLNEVLGGTVGADVLVGGAGKDVFDGLAGDDKLFGGLGNDILTGGAGTDILTGGAGNDTFHVEAGDRVVEASGGGTDIIVTSGNFSLSGSAVEQLLAQNANATSALRLTGNQLNNRIVGNSGNNLVNGGKGNDALFGGKGNDKIYGNFGNDTLTGGLGKDAFVFDSSVSKTARDKIADFKPVDDVVHLENAVFKGLKKGNLSKDAFHVGKAAADAEDWIIYDRKTGNLFFDKDGSGGASAVKFAILKAGLALTYKDFYVV